MDTLKLEDFHFSKTVGFLLEDPLTELPEYFKPWQDIAYQVGELMVNGSIREYVGTMPLLDHTKLSGHRQWRLAYMQLCFINSGYIWQDGPDNLPQVIPSQLAIPLAGTAAHLGVPVGISYPAFCLSNYTRLDRTKEVSLDNMKSICLFPGGKTYDAFNCITLCVDLAAVKGINVIPDCLSGVIRNDANMVIKSLNTIVESLSDMVNTMKSYHERMDAKIFYTKVRSALGGFGDGSTARPDGIVFEGVSSEPKSLVGISAAQSSTIQCYDALLRIQHDPDKISFLQKMRSYMMPSHRGLIETLWTGPSVRDFVEACPENTDLQKAYNDSVLAVKNFRSYHIQIVTKFIVSMSDKTNKEQEKGTGGQEVIPFLKGIRDSTGGGQLS